MYIVCARLNFLEFTYELWVCRLVLSTTIVSNISHIIKYLQTLVWKQSLSQWPGCMPCVWEVTIGVMCKGQEDRGGLRHELWEVEWTREGVNRRACCKVSYWYSPGINPGKSLDKPRDCIVRLYPSEKRGTIYLLTPDLHWLGVSIKYTTIEVVPVWGKCLDQCRTDLQHLGQHQRSPIQQQAIPGSEGRSCPLHLRKADWSLLCNCLSQLCVKWETRMILK